MKSLIILIISFLLLHCSTSAQSSLSVGFQGGIPTNEFKSAAPSVFGLGFGVNGVGQIAGSPLHLGLDFSYQVYGTETSTTLVWIDGFWEEGDLTRNNNLMQGHFLARLKPPVRFPVKPYFDAMIGAKYIYTRSKINVDGFDEPFDPDTEVSDWALSFGGATGVHVKITRDIYLDFRLLYLRGSKAEYLTRNDVFFDDIEEEWVFETQKSRTDLFMPHLGVSFYLD